MSVMLVKDEMFDELNSKLKEKNLTIAAGPSRSTVSFTNNFTLVAPEYKDDTVIGVYRPLSQCKGEPCDASKKENIGASSTEVILCECLKAGDTNIFAKGLKDAADVTKNSTQVIGDAIKDGAEKLFTDPNTLTDYQLWRNSVIYIFGAMTLIGVACMAFDGRLITPLAIGFFNKFSVDFMISQQLKKIRSSKSTKSEKKHNKDSNRANDSSGSSTENNSGKLTSEERGKMEKLKRAVESEDAASKAFKSVKTFKEMSSAKLFLIIYLTNHYTLSVFFSKGVHYSRKSMIINLYDRIVYNLAITMLFAIGYNKDGYSSYQSFILKCMFLPFVTSVLLFLIKKLMKNDNTYGMSIFKWCPNKNALPNVTDLSTASSNSPLRNRLENRPASRDENTNVRPSLSKIKPRAGSRVTLKDPKSKQPKSTQDFLDSPESGNDSPQHADSVLDSDSYKDAYNPTIVKDVQPQPNRSKKGAALIIFSYILSLSLLPISLFIVLSVAQKTDDDNWPVGYWYYMQLAYDLTIGQLIPAFLQYYFLSCYLKGRYLQKGFMAFMAKKNPLLNSDVKALTELDNSIVT